MADGLERLRELQPEAFARLEEADAIARSQVDADLLDRCVARASALLGRDGADDEPAPADPRDRAYLDLTEQFATSVGSVDHEQVQALLEHSSEDGVYAFLGALYIAEARLRLEIVTSAVLR